MSKERDATRDEAVREVEEYGDLEATGDISQAGLDAMKGWYRLALRHAEELDRLRSASSETVQNALSSFPSANSQESLMIEPRYNDAHAPVRDTAPTETARNAIIEECALACLPPFAKGDWLTTKIWEERAATIRVLKNAAPQVLVMATSGTRFAEADSPDLDRLEPATSVKSPSATPAVSADLLPCPFCGGEASRATCTITRDRNAEGDKSTFTGHYVNCIVCGSDNRGIAEGSCTPQQAAERWNRRIPSAIEPIINACGSRALYAGTDTCMGLKIMASNTVPVGEVHIRDGHGKLVGKIINVY